MPRPLDDGNLWTPEEIEALHADETKTRDQLRSESHRSRTLVRGVVQDMIGEADPLNGREKDVIRRLSKHQRIAMSAVALSPKVVQKAVIVTTLALTHYESRLNDPNVSAEMKDRIARIALELAPKAVAAATSLFESAEGAFDLPGGERSDQADELPPEARQLLETAQAIVKREKGAAPGAPLQTDAVSSPSTAPDESPEGT